MSSRGSYYVLTGERNSGKSMICSDLAAEARARDLEVAGILTCLAGPELQAPREVVDIRTGSTRLFGRVGGSDSEQSTTPARSQSLVFAWADGVLESATPCDLLIIDELGPLELEGDGGFAAALPVLQRGDFGAALVVCRPDMVTRLHERMEDAPAMVFEAEPENSDSLPETILTQMFD